MDIAILIAIVSIAISFVVPSVIAWWQDRRAKRQIELAELSLAHSERPVWIDVLARIRKEKTAIIGYFHYPPFVYAEPNKPRDPSGFYVAILSKFLRMQGIRPQFTPINFRSAIEGIANYKLDLVLCIFETPRRRRCVDFCALMHTISVSGVARQEENRIHVRSDLADEKLTFAVFVEEAGDEILKDQLRIPDSRLRRQETWNIAEIIESVATRRVDVAIADTLSCCAGLDAHGSKKPKLKAILKDHPLGRCPNGVMIGLNQEGLSNWLHQGLVKILKQPEFSEAEDRILSKYAGVIEKIL